MKKSVLLIGIDGATWDLLNLWINENNFPTLSKFINSGVSADLKSVIPTISCSAWTSLFTGTNPGKHGIYEYLTDSGKLVNSKSIKSEKIWHIISQHKKRCCVVNVPLTYPLEEINGYMISGLLTPQDGKNYVYPSKIEPILKKHGYKIGVDYGKNIPLIPDIGNIVEERDMYLKELYDISERRYLTAKDLMAEQWDFFMLIFDETSALQDLFWNKKEVIMEFFKKLDLYIGDLIKTFYAKNSNPYIFITSDHGFAAAPVRVFNFRVWMNKNGFIKDKRSFFQKTIPKIYGISNKIPLSKLIFDLKKLKQIRESFQRKINGGWSIYYKNPGIFIRQDDLKENCYEELRNKIMSKLNQTRDPLTEKSPFLIVKKREEIYSGRNSKFAPDIVVVPKENYTLNFSLESKKEYDDIKLNLSGRHNSSLHGVFLGYGKEISNTSPKNVSILDVCPTILHILDAPIPRDVDGKVSKEIFKENSELYKKEVVYSDEKSISEKDRIKDAIRAINI